MWRGGPGSTPFGLAGLMRAGKGGMVRTMLFEKKEDGACVLKPVWWRQASFTLFLLLLWAFFYAVEFKEGWGWLGWSARILAGATAGFGLFDQAFGWSRLRVDAHGCSLRGWFRRADLLWEELEAFELREYAYKPLVVARLTKKANRKRKATDGLLPYPCAFGRPAEEVFKELEELRKRRWHKD